MIFILILILSRPTYKTSTTNNLKDKSTIIILLDNSVSNYYNVENNFDTFINKIKKEYSPNSDVEVVCFGENQSIFSNKLNFLNNIDFNITYNEIDLNNTLIFLNNFKSINSNNTLIVYSDFQNNDINYELNKYINNYADLWNIILYRSSNNNFNLSLSSIQVASNIIVPNEIVEIKANVLNNTDVDVKNKKISFNINDINVGLSNISINSYSTESISFKTSFAEFGNNTCKIVLDDDDFNLDNTYYFNINIPLNHNISILHNNENEIYFLKNAFYAMNNRYNNINVKYFNYDNYLSSNITEDSALFIFGYENITSAILNKIASSSLNVIIVPSTYNSNNLLSDYFNDISIRDIRSQQLLGDSYITLQNNNIDDTYLFHLFNDTPSLSNKNIKVFKSYNIPNSDFTKIEYNNNNAFINSYRYKNNNVHLLASGLSLNDSNLPIKGSFIPFLYYLINSTYATNYRFNDIDKDLFQNIFSDKFNIKTSDGEIISTNIHKNNSIYFNKPSFYKLYHQNNEFTLPLNINIDEFETIPSSIDLKETFKKNKIIENYNDLSVYIKNTLHGIELSTYLIYIFIFLISIEMFLSNIYTHDKKQ